jgi:uncharacterized peroxidase-related enzyme
MAWIRRIAPEQATGALARLFDRIRARSSAQRVAHLWQTLALDPAALEGAFAHYRALADDPAPLTPAQAEMIALVVSATNGCAYCVAHHGPRLARIVGEELARDVARDYREANLAARDRVLLDAAVALTCEPAERRAEDVERLREYGFDDPAVVKAVALAAYYNFANRVACALGVEPEPGLAAWSFGDPR